MNSHVLLINPLINPASQSRIVNSMLGKYFPTNLGVLAGYVAGSGLTDVRVLDEQMGMLDEPSLDRQLRALTPPRVVGLTCMTISSSRAYQLVKAVKRIDPQCTVVLGGIHATVMPNEGAAVEEVDVVIRGEGEETFREWLDCCLNDRDFRGMAGISFRKDGIMSSRHDNLHLLDSVCFLSFSTLSACGVPQYRIMRGNYHAPHRTGRAHFTHPARQRYFREQSCICPVPTRLMAQFSVSKYGCSIAPS